MASKRENQKLVRVASVKTGTKSTVLPGTPEFAGSPFNYQA